MADHLPNARRFPAMLEEKRWSSGVRMVVQGAMQAVKGEHQVNLHASWRADVYFGRGRKPAFTFVSETPAKLFRDLAWLCDGAPAANPDGPDHE